MGVLGQKVKSDGLDAGGLASLLGGQRSAIMSAAPAVLSSLLGLGGTSAGAAHSAASGAAKAASGGSSMLWPVLIGLAVIGGLWMWLRGGTPQVQDAAQQAQQAGQQAAQQVGEAAQGAAGQVQVAAANLGTFLKRQLPGNVELNIPERGTESQVLVFIADDTVAVKPGTWFDFDRILFETGSAALRSNRRSRSPTSSPS